MLTPTFPFNPLWIRTFHSLFLHTQTIHNPVKEVSLGSAITIGAMKRAPKGGKGETEWQQMTRHSQLFNNA